MVIFLFWRGIGFLLLPLLFLHPKGRRHIWKVPKPDPGLIWIHGASAGEHQIVGALSQQLQTPTWRTHTSWRTKIYRSWPAPLDLPFVFSQWIDWARPSMLILAEAELWPGWIWHCKKRKIPIVVVNDKPSKAKNRWKRWRLWKSISQDVTFITQGQTGELKGYAPLKTPCQFKRPIFIAGSTQQGDEQKVLTIWQQLSSPKPILLIAPRKLSRINEVEQILKKQNVRYQKKTQISDLNCDVVVLDTMGELSSFYPQAIGAFIGGTFSKSIGGHSPAEANRYAIPVVSGPHIHSNPQAWKESKHLMATNPKELLTAFQQALARESTPQMKRSNQPIQRCIALLPTPSTPKESQLRPYLYPLTFMWKAIGQRMPNYSSNPQKLPIPIVSIGSISAGGTGKTAIAHWITKNWTGSVVLSRGYKRPKIGPLVRTEKDLGDELEMLRRKGVHVISCPDRIAGAKFAIQQGARGIVLDDGFQHRKIARDIDVVCIDARWPTSRGVIPVGWGREEWSAIKRADFVWYHNWSATLPSLPTINKPVIKSHYKPTGWIHKGKRYPLDFVQGEVTAMVGTAISSGFWTFLSQLQLTVVTARTLKNHQAIKTTVPGTLMTEKDAARLPPDTDVWALQVDLVVQGAEPLLKEIQKWNS